VAFFVKLFSGIVQSTVWREDLHVKVVWITLLALCDSRGNVSTSVPGLATSAGVSLDQCVEALERLMAPDKWSRTQEHEGRRIEEIDGGYRVLNYLKYRQMRDEEKRNDQTREATRRWRQRVGSITDAHSAHGDQGEPIRARARVRTTDLLPTYSSSVGRESVQAPADPLEAPVERDVTVTPQITPDPLFLRAHDAEKAIRLSTDALRTKLYGLVAEMVKADPEHSDATELMRLVTAYDKPDGKRVPGVVNAAMLSHERLENSIADAEALLAEWRGARGAK
jgi:hypothetical protein